MQNSINHFLPEYRQMNYKIKTNNNLSISSSKTLYLCESKERKKERQINIIIFLLNNIIKTLQLQNYPYYIWKKKKKKIAKIWDNLINRLQWNEKYIKKKGIRPRAKKFEVTISNSPRGQYKSIPLPISPDSTG